MTRSHLPDPLRALARDVSRREETVVQLDDLIHDQLVSRIWSLAPDRTNVSLPDAHGKSRKVHDVSVGARKTDLRWFLHFRQTRRS